MEKWKELLCLVPSAPEWQINWKQIEDSALPLIVQKMKMTMQNPLWHREGDVWTHTRMVCECLLSFEEYRKLGRRKQEEVFLAALLHDIGKIPCTRIEDGTWKSPNHTAVGARMARKILWREYVFCGKRELQEFRETVCTLIRYHSVPPHILEQKNPEHRIIQIASNGELMPDFSVELLCLLEKADMCGRISDTEEASLEMIELCIAQAEESGCLKAPLKFPTAFSEYAYLEGRNIMPGQKMYDDTWGEVIMMAGLPGTGKDTWIREHYGNYSAISLDEIRKQMKIRPTETQGAVLNAARELAKSYMREKMPFVWNATCLTPILRRKQLCLFKDYNASVKIVFLETDWEEQMRRNQGRKEEVPEQIIDGMMGNMVLPERFEAQRVEWYCI